MGFGVILGLPLILLAGTCHGQTATQSPVGLTTEDGSQNASHILGEYISLINSRDYDYRLPPHKTDRPVSVYVQMYINGIGDIDEAQMTYRMDVYFRQLWTDFRLEFEAAFPEEESISLPDAYYSDIWIPDVFVENGQDEMLHDITLPNRGFRVYRNGTVFYSQRLSLYLRCEVNLMDFPLDRQKCRMSLMTYRYNSAEMTLSWMHSPLEIGKVTLLRFELLRYDTGDCTYGFSTGQYSCVYVEFNFKRLFGYYMSQIYIPSALVVFLSWVSFWLEPSAVPARISLGLLTILTMTGHMATASSSLPKVSYLKAIDVWMTTCLCFLFAQLMEFAMVNSMVRKETMRQRNDIRVSNNRVVPFKMPKTSGKGSDMDADSIKSGETDSYAVASTPCPSRFRWKDLTAVRLDWLSRIVFPVCFLFFNLVYWMYYSTVSNK